MNAVVAPAPVSGPGVLARGATRALMSTAGLLAGPRLPILIFHRVHAQADPLFPEEMTAVRFDRLVGLLARSMRPMALGEAARALAEGRLPARSIAITFDDGYADNAEVAMPILRRHGIGATFFISTGFLDGGRMWNDEVIETLRRCRAPEIDGSSFGLGRLPLHDDAARRRAVDLLLPKVKYQGLAEREEALARLREAAGAPALPADLMMRSDQVRALVDGGMEIGAHTVRHPILQQVPLDEARREIADGRAALERLTGRPVELFAYPNGRPGKDYGDAHVQLVRELGFRFAVSTAQRVASPGEDPHQLPRFTPWDRSLPRYMLRLAAAYRSA